MPAGSGYHDYCLGYGHNEFALAFWIEASPAEVNEISYLGLQIDYVVDYVIYWTRAISLGFTESFFRGPLSRLDVVSFWTTTSPKC
jgi:hypothetical protein